MILKLIEKFAMTIVAAFAKEAVEMLVEGWGKVKDWWNGKTIAIIGPTASGKNSMFNKLRKIPAPIEHIQTRGAEQVGKFEINWALPDSTKVSMTCKKSINVGGEVDERERYWLQSCNNADVIFYLVDGKKLLDEEGKTLKRIRDDLKWIAKNFNSFKPDVVLHLLINKIDVAMDYDDKEAFREHVVQKFSSGMSGIEKSLDVVLGKIRARVAGVSPISMMDDYLFSTYFSDALQSIQEFKTKEAGK